MTGQEPTAAERAAVVLEALKRTLDRYRWCWDCGTTESQCKGRARSVGAPQKCCPDCRHRGWPEQLDVDVDPDGTLTRAIQMLAWKAGGTVVFTEQDAQEVALLELPQPELAMAGDPVMAGWWARVRLPGWPPVGTEADDMIRRMRGE